LVESWDLVGDTGETRGLRRNGHSVHRQHDSQGSPLRRRWKRGAQTQAIGRSRGGRITKIHAVVDGDGRFVAFELTGGNRHDIKPAAGLIETLPPAKSLLGDAAYDSDAFRTLLIARGTTPVIKQNPTRKRLQPFDKDAYKGRNIIERAFSHLKDWRRVATRYDKLARNFSATVVLASILRWCT
jgi:transposase